MRAQWSRLIYAAMAHPGFEHLTEKVAEDGYRVYFWRWAWGKETPAIDKKAWGQGQDLWHSDKPIDGKIWRKNPDVGVVRQDGTQ